LSRDYLDALQRIASDCEAEERRYRREAQRRIEELAAARVDAYRRLNVLKAMVEAAATQAEPDASIAAQVRRVGQMTGWSESDAGWQDFRTALGEVAACIHEDLNPMDGVERSREVEARSVTAAFQSFEAWYRGHFGAAFLALLEPDAQFQPAVDF
jgi:hypothetical protein